MNKTGKYVSIFMWVLIVITAILAISFIANISDNKTDPAMNSWLSTNLVWTYIMLALSLFLLVAFAAYQMVTNFKEAKKGLMAMLLGVGVFVLAFIFASDELPTFLGAQKFIDAGTITPSIMKWIDTGLIGTYIVLAASFVSIIYASVSRLFK